MGSNYQNHNMPRWEIELNNARGAYLHQPYYPFGADAHQHPMYGSWQRHQAQEERRFFPAEPVPNEGDYAGDYDGGEEYYDPEFEEPQPRRNRRRNRRRHDGVPGPRHRAHGPGPRNPPGPLLDILQPVIVGAERTMEMTLHAFDALFEEQADGYVPGMDFKDQSGASITGFKHQDGLRATVVIKGTEIQVAEAFDLLEDHNLHYSINGHVNHDEAMFAPPHHRRRRRGRNTVIFYSSLRYGMEI